MQSRNKFKRIVCIALAVIMTLSLVSTALILMVNAASSKEIEKELVDLRAQQAELKKQSDALKAETRRENIVGYTLPNGRTLNVLAEGRLVNLAAGNGHPAEIMDMSFAVQALAAEWLTKQTGLEKKVYPVPEEIDDQIGRAKLAALGLEIDALTPEQEAYLNSWSV